MFIGYTSDERYVALPDVLLEFQSASGSFEARSRATGAVYADVPPGDCRVTLSKPGFGSKSVDLTVRPGQPHHFRLLSDGLAGYAWPKWVKSGERSEFRVHAVEAYKLELWRYGWQKEFIRGLGWHDEHGPRATMQVTPDGDYTQTGVKFNEQGYDRANHSQYVEGPQRSGLYYFHARTAAGLFFSFPWIVAPAKPQAPIAVLASNITWNVYNAFGGRSNYISADHLPDRPTVNSRQDLSRYTDPKHSSWAYERYMPLSFERPEPINVISPHEQITDLIEGRSACHVAPAEWRLFGWLEREGFEYDLYAETQFHFGELDLDRYKVLIVSTHPEYWSKDMYYALKSWVFERGGKLLYLGGNGLDCEVEFLDRQTVVAQNGNWKVGLEGPRHPQKMESRFHTRQESQANLVGVVFTAAGAMTGAPYRAIDSKHWVFTGTGLRQGQLFGEKSLHMRCPGGASGHETDKISASSPKNIQLLAKGTNADEGGAEMVFFDAPSGGAVFSAGSIAWPSSLVVDDAVSKITANVIRRFLE